MKLQWQYEDKLIVWELSNKQYRWINKLLAGEKIVRVLYQNDISFFIDYEFVPINFVVMLLDWLEPTVDGFVLLKPVPFDLIDK